MRWREHVDVRERVRYRLRGWLVIFKTEQWIQPDDAPHLFPNDFELLGHAPRMSRVPSVAQNDEQGIAREKPGVMEIEFTERFADLGTARLVRHAIGQRFEHITQFARAQHPIDVDQRRAEHERAGAPEIAVHRVRESQ